MTISCEEGEVATPGFPRPGDVATPPGAEGWEEMYPYHLLFGEDRRDADESRFWFQDGVHASEPLYPFDALWIECGVAAFSQSNARLFVIPPSLGIELRVLNGYYYYSGNPVTDEETLARREALFMDRGGYYYRHWDDLYAHWVEKMDATTRELVELEVPELPEFEDLAVITEARGVGSTYALLRAYDGMLENFDLAWQYHFELNALGYGAYLVFYDLCRQLFPAIPDQSVAKMVSGIDVLVLRPDAELRRLARSALEHGVGDAVKAAADEDELRAALDGSEWLVDYDAAKDPWFHFSFGNGLCHDHRSWVDDTRIPIRTVAGYVERLEAGEEIDPPHAAVADERDRITDEYRSLLDPESRQRFDESLGLSRTVFPFVENHNFYVEHRYLTIFWNKVREFGALLAQYGFLEEGEDVFFLRHDEVREALEELRMVWASAGAGSPRGPSYWPPIVARRKPIYAALRAAAPPPAVGALPDAISDPSLIMLWGLTPELLASWLGADEDGGGVSGVGASPGVAEGPARVILHVERLGELEVGEILVAPSTSTSWTPVFGKIAGAVLDTGGIMCHAAIVAREYGLPAVVGTGTATRKIKTGDRIRVDAHTGVVTIL